MFLRASFMCPRKRAPKLAATVVARKRPRTVRALAGLGVYEYSADVSKVIGDESNWTWSVEAFGDVGDDASRTEIYNLIVGKANSLLDAEAIDDRAAGWMTRGAAGGVLATPSLSSAMAADAFAKVAYYKMMNDTGLWQLRQQVRRLTKRAVLKEARELAANQALWDSIATSMEYVSGAKAIDKLNEYVANIKTDVGAIKDMVAEARATLPADKAGLVAAAAKGTDASLANLSKWVPGATDDTGTTGLGWVQAVVAIAVGVAIGVAAICWAYVNARKMAVASKLAEMTEAQRQAEVAAAEAKRQAAADAIDAQVAAGTLTAEKGATLKLQSAEEAEAAIQAAGARAEESKKKAAEVAASGGGLFGLDFKWIAIAAAVAAVGLLVLPQIGKLVPKKSA